MNIFNKYALKTLQKNRSRTLVTIIGIILSASMLTAVTTLASSLQNFLVNTAIAESGDWHGAVFDLNQDEYSQLSANEDMTLKIAAQNIGYALTGDNSYLYYKPYIYVLGANADFFEYMPVELVSGRLPQSKDEIILPRQLMEYGRAKYVVGDRITLEIGDRYLDGQKLGQQTSYQFEEDNEDPVYGEAQILESFVPRVKKTYTVVGIYERDGFQSYDAPGFTAISLWDDSVSNMYDIYFKLKNPRDTVAFIDNYSGRTGNTATVNYDYLRFIGASGEKSFERVLYGLAAVLMGLIMFASVSLIYNAFSISVSERTKQFGLISSIGASRGQIRRSVLFEAIALSVVGIPVGILCGVGGIAVTLNALSGSLVFLARGIASGGNVDFTLKVSWGAVITAGAVGLATVLISAYIPLRKALKTSAIEAIRQTDDIKIKAKNVKTSKLVYKLFGFEGMIASKNFKRNKQKYRATVVSLFMSIVLFISASSFCAYLTKSVDSVIDTYEFDIYFGVNNNDDSGFEELYNNVKAVNGVTKSSYNAFRDVNADIKTENISKRYLEYLKTIPDEEDIGDAISVGFSIYFVEDDTYRQYLDENRLDAKTYMDTQNPKGVAVDFLRKYDTKEERYNTFNLFEKKAVDLEFSVIKDIEGYTLCFIDENDGGVTTYTYTKNEYSESLPSGEIIGADGDSIKLSESEAFEYMTLNIGAVLDKPPYGIMYGEQIVVLYPFSAAEAVLGKYSSSTFKGMYLSADDPMSAAAQMEKMILDNGTQGYVYNYAEEAETNRAIITIINVFSTGFIVLISLIAAANVFNTISTNINLRRREFAMLKSVGMTRRGFNRMMNFECLLYGIKGLAYGLPASFVLIWLIFMVISQGLETSFFVPVNSVIIAVASVFAVVFATMIYSMRKIKRENTIDALKNENF